MGLEERNKIWGAERETRLQWSKSELQREQRKRPETQTK